MGGLTTKHIMIFGIFIILLNLVFELFISILNTPDKIDAIYGIVGVSFGFIFLYMVKKNGLKTNEL